MADNLLQLIKDTKIDLTKAFLVPSSGHGYLESKFDIKPKDFLRFARQDIKQDDDRGFINGLTNAKRAIDCQVDEALDKCAIKHDNFSDDINDFLDYFELDNDVPIKLKIIHALNLAPSLLISKTRTLRNQLEHIYKKPSKAKVKEAIDVADLFIRSIEGKFNSLTNDFGLTDEKNYVHNNHCDFKNGLFFSFDTDKLHFTINKIIDTKSASRTTFNVKDKGYYGILRLMLSIGDDPELEESLKATLKHIGHPMPSDKVSLLQA